MRSTTNEAHQKLLESVNVALEHVGGLDGLLNYLEDECTGGGVTELTEAQQMVMDYFRFFLEVAQEDYARKNPEVSIDDLMRILTETKIQTDKISKSLARWAQ